MMKFSLAVAIFARDNTSALQLKLTLLSISKPEWFCIHMVLFWRTHFFRLFLEITVSAEYFYTLSVWKLFSCEVRISTWLYGRSKVSNVMHIDHHSGHIENRIHPRHISISPYRLPVWKTQYLC